MRTGYKGFDERDGKLYCRDMEFKVGEIAEVEGPLEICRNGIHFCWKLNDVNEYYSLRNRVICEVEPLGDIAGDTEGKKFCTNRLKVLRILTKEEVLEISNTGKDNTGYMNTGNCNTGDFNTGDRNTGNYNTGDRNTGNCNTGDFNTGDYNNGDYNNGNCNTGDYNTGDYNNGDYNNGDYNNGNCNTGDRNTGYCNTGYCNNGNCNTGDYNTGNYNTGFFNVQEHKCFIFDKPSDFTPTEFRKSKFYSALCSSPFILTEWIEYTEEEKAEDKSKIGGYLKEYTYKEACANWWNGMTVSNKKIVTEIPNFDPDKFERITGIDVRKEGLWK